MPKSVASTGTSKSLRSLNSISAHRAASRATANSKSLHRPLLHVSHSILQKGSYIASIYTIVLALFTIAHSIFDIYCLAKASVGTVHYGYHLISFEFVYVGNKYVRGTLFAVAGVSFLLAFALFFTSFVLIQALRKENPARFKPWLIVMLIFTIFRLLAFIYWSVINDILFPYHITMLVLWILFTIANGVLLAFVYSLYQELCNITRLEDMVKLKGTLSSLSTHPSHHSVHTVHSISQPSPRVTNLPV